MELNFGNQENNNNNIQNNEVKSIKDNPIKDLINLNNKIESTLFDKIHQLSFLKELKLKIYHSLYENHSFKNDYKIIPQIIENIEKQIINYHDEIDSSIIETLENLMMLFLFHFDIHIIKIGFKLIKLLIDNIEESYSNELLEYFIKIIQLLNIKKQANNENFSVIITIIIYNISLGIYIIMSNNQIIKENKKSFFEFIKKNILDINLIYLFFIPCGNTTINYSKILNNDEIRFIYEKISENLNRTYTDLVNNLPSKKMDVIYIKEKVNQIGIFCKILNSVTIEGNRTYIIDKLIKNMVPIGQRILETFNYFIELQNKELKLCSETVENIFEYFNNIGVFSFDNIIKAICFVNKMFTDYSNNYLSIIIYLVNQLYKFALSTEENKSKNIILLIIQIIDIVLKRNKFQNNNEIKLDIYELYKINKIYNFLLKIDLEIEIPKDKFPNAYSFFKENNINCFDSFEKGFNEKNNNFLSEKYLNSIAAGNSENKCINKNSFLNCLNKFEDFANSFKESLDIKKTLSFDQIIEKEKKEIKNKENVSCQDFETFFLKNSMEMFNEICSIK